MKKALVLRYGAYGDNLMITPVLKRLKGLGYYVIVNTNTRGFEIFANNPNIDKFLRHDEDIPKDELYEHWDKMKDEVKPDVYLNFTESIECNLALHPSQPLYIYPKQDRYDYCNRNYYDVTAEWSGLTRVEKRPIMYYTEEEEKEARSLLKKDKFNVLWALSGSGLQKVYPWTDYVMSDLFKAVKDLHVITVGDIKCQLLESLDGYEITNMAGRIPIRTAMCLTKFVDLVISPDTGILHASGQWDTPKIGLLGNTTKENITKHFINDHSIEAQCACSPCFRLIYDKELQCPIEPVTKGTWCMAVGIAPEVLYDKVRYVIANERNKRLRSAAAAIN